MSVGKQSETFIKNELEEMISLGHTVTLVTFSIDKNFFSNDYRAVRENTKLICISGKDTVPTITEIIRAITLNPKALLDGFRSYKKRRIQGWQLLWSLKVIGSCKKQPDLIHSHFTDWNSLLGSVLSEIYSIPFSATLHGYDIRDYPIGKTGLVKLSKRTSCFVNVSESNISELIKIGIDREKLVLLRCGIKLDNILTKPQFNLNQKLRLITVARLHPVKNHMMILKSLVILKARKVNFSYTIVGAGTEQEKLVQFCVKNKLTEQVCFLGEKGHDYVCKNLYNYDIHLLCSKNESLGQVNLEAMYAKLTCIVTEVGGMPEIVINNSNGYTVQLDDARSLAEKIEFLDKNRILLNHYGNNGHRMVLTDYDFSKLVIDKLRLLSSFSK